MNISIIKINLENIYSSSKELSILSYFLIDDIGAREPSSLINWLKNDKYSSAVLNYSFIKKSGNNISIHAFYDGFEREENCTREKFVIGIDMLIKIVNQWHEIYSKYIYIKITEENGSINLVGAHKKFSQTK